LLTRQSSQNWQLWRRHPNLISWPAIRVELPDSGGRHAMAAARAGRADVIVTGNVADFPPGAPPTPLIRRSLESSCSTRSTFPGGPADPGRA